MLFIISGVHNAEKIGDSLKRRAELEVELEELDELL